MAKALELYWGTDSANRSIEVAQSVEGLWFYRVYEFNGYDKAWSRWQKMEAPSRPKGYRNHYSGEWFAYTEEERADKIEWGFHVFTGTTDCSDVRYRLPNKPNKLVA